MKNNNIKNFFYNFDGVGFINEELFYKKKTKQNKKNKFLNIIEHVNKKNKYKIFYNYDGIGFIN